MCAMPHLPAGLHAHECVCRGREGEEGKARGQISGCRERKCMVGVDVGGNV